MKQRFLNYARSFFVILKQFKLQGVITAFTSDAAFAQLLQPLGQRPLILSGHPGDEVMALGGTMARYVKQDITLQVLTFTAGYRGTNTGKRSKSLGPKRHKEQLAAFAQIGGTINLTPWNLEEKFVVNDSFVQQLSEYLDELNPDIIYVPSVLDDHPDSRAINAALQQALHRLPSTRLKHLLIAQYELWTPIVPNRILSINDFEATKQKAIECHESQLLCRNYLDAMLGLNRYRAAMLGAGSFAEAFFMCTAPQYLQFGPQNAAHVVEMVLD